MSSLEGIFSSLGGPREPRPGGAAHVTPMGSGTSSRPSIAAQASSQRNPAASAPTAVAAEDRSFLLCFSALGRGGHRIAAEATVSILGAARSNLASRSARVSACRIAFLAARTAASNAATASA